MWARVSRNLALLRVRLFDRLGYAASDEETETLLEHVQAGGEAEFVLTEFGTDGRRPRYTVHKAAPDPDSHLSSEREKVSYSVDGDMLDFFFDQFMREAVERGGEAQDAQASVVASLRAEVEALQASLRKLRCDSDLVRSRHERSKQEQRLQLGRFIKEVCILKEQVYRAQVDSGYVVRECNLIGVSLEDTDGNPLCTSVDELLECRAQVLCGMEKKKETEVLIQEAYNKLQKGHAQLEQRTKRVHELERTSKYDRETIAALQKDSYSVQEQLREGSAKLLQLTRQVEEIEAAKAAELEAAHQRLKEALDSAEAARARASSAAAAAAPAAACADALPARPPSQGSNPGSPSQEQTSSVASGGEADGVRRPPPRSPSQAASSSGAVTEASTVAEAAAAAAAAAAESESAATPLPSTDGREKKGRRASRASSSRAGGGGGGRRRSGWRASVSGRRPETRSVGVQAAITDETAMSIPEHQLSKNIIDTWKAKPRGKEDVVTSAAKALLRRTRRGSSTAGEAPAPTQQPLVTELVTCNPVATPMSGPASPASFLPPPAATTVVVTPAVVQDEQACPAPEHAASTAVRAAQPPAPAASPEDQAPSADADQTACPSSSTAPTEKAAPASASAPPPAAAACTPPGSGEVVPAPTKAAAEPPTPATPAAAGEVHLSLLAAADADTGSLSAFSGGSRSEHPVPATSCMVEGRTAGPQLTEAAAAAAAAAAETWASELVSPASSPTPAASLHCASPVGGGGDGNAEEAYLGPDAPSPVSPAATPAAGEVVSRLQYNTAVSDVAKWQEEARQYAAALERTNDELAKVIRYEEEIENSLKEKGVEVEELKVWVGKAEILSHNLNEARAVITDLAEEGSDLEERVQTLEEQNTNLLQHNVETATQLADKLTESMTHVKILFQKNEILETAFVQHKRELRTLKDRNGVEQFKKLVAAQAESEKEEAVTVATAGLQAEIDRLSQENESLRAGSRRMREHLRMRCEDLRTVNRADKELMAAQEAAHATLVSAHSQLQADHSAALAECRELVRSAKTHEDAASVSVPRPAEVLQTLSGLVSRSAPADAAAVPVPGTAAEDPQQTALVEKSTRKEQHPAVIPQGTYTDPFVLEVSAPTLPAHAAPEDKKTQMVFGCYLIHRQIVAFFQYLRARVEDAAKLQALMVKPTSAAAAAEAPSAKERQLDVALKQWSLLSLEKMSLFQSVEGKLQSLQFYMKHVTQAIQSNSLHLSEILSKDLPALPPPPPPQQQPSEPETVCGDVRQRAGSAAPLALGVKAETPTLAAAAQRRRQPEAATILSECRATHVAPLSLSELTTQMAVMRRSLERGSSASKRCSGPQGAAAAALTAGGVLPPLPPALPAADYCGVEFLAGRPCTPYEEIDTADDGVSPQAEAAAEASSAMDGAPFSNLRRPDVRRRRSTCALPKRMSLKRFEQDAQELAACTQVIQAEQAALCSVTLESRAPPAFVGARLRTSDSPVLRTRSRQGRRVTVKSSCF